MKEAKLDLGNKDLLSQMAIVEKKLQFDSTEHRYMNITNEQLENAANILLYLIIIGPTVAGDISLGSTDSSIDWFFYYKDLFDAHSLSHIILTLNRMTKKRKSISKDKVVFDDLAKATLQK